MAKFNRQSILEWMDTVEAFALAQNVDPMSRAITIGAYTASPLTEAAIGDYMATVFDVAETGVES